MALIGTLYEAALEPELWPEAFAGLLRRVDAQVGQLGFVDRSSGQITHSIAWGTELDPEASAKGDAEYVAYYGAIDPRLATMARMGVREWMLDHQHFDEAFYRRSEFFNDFLFRYGVRYMFATRLSDLERHSIFLGTMRSLGSTPFGEDDIRRLKRVETHLARPARLYHKSEDLRLKLDGGLRALDTLDFPALIADGTGTIRFANAAAEALLSTPAGLSVRSGRLVHALPRDNALLNTLIRDAAAGKGGGMRLPRGGERPDLHLSMAPLSARSRLAAPWQTPLVLLLVSDPAAQRVPPEQLLRLLFGLSPAEARLAGALVRGLSPGEYAADSGLSLSTARTQVRRLFEKTHTRRLAELVKLLASLPAVRVDWEGG
ncbi:helix-turn-helix transcriptional regulator [Methylococcus mesophilus]|uniref:helix-turn-helix transcriptional regulator n=1 Tax=Methylococcus mesophilus TaxID=2993564 RepID=UPI00224B0981|nr:hypothetical protein [Methylococcus mesophilus]UZR27144.1 hypothetical protein OOT43_10375 [Methylococcus mesophilus]